jgi:iron complex outermembrane receptor protein
MRNVLWLALCVLGCSLPCAATTQLPSTRQLAELSLEQLAAFEITSVSRRAEPLAEAPASVFVLTAEDIRRSGARSLPDLLRLAPNLQVAQASANAYAVRARGVHNNSANKLLVLIDGRSVYTPLFAGVFWDVQDVMLEDVERIEVVSGPGGTLWGVNAVNGVINVITRHAARTQGTLLAAAAGEAFSDAAVRHGGAIGGGHVRVFAKYLDRDHTRTADGAVVDDRAHLAQAGFRGDWRGDRGEVRVNGNAYRGLVGQPRPGSISITGVDLALGPIPVSGANLTASWTRRLANGSEVLLQAYYDRTSRSIPPTFAEDLDLFDVHFQHSLEASAPRSFVWGAGYRRGRDRVDNGTVFAFLPANVNQVWASVFGQADAELAENVRATVGARLERNDYTGTEFLPNLRLAWTPAEESLLWAVAARAVRAPSRLDRDPFIPAAPPFLLAGGPNTRAEVATSLELGYRGRAGMLAWSAAVFRAEYDHLHTQEVAPSRTFITFDGLMEASTTGVEAWATWSATPRWRLSAGYAALRETFRLKPGSNNVTAVGLAGRDPAHSWVLRSSLDLTDTIELDLVVRASAALDNPAVPAYRAADVRLGWRPRPGIELAIVARNLGGGHGEFTAAETRSELEPSVHASLAWTFGAR